MTTRTAEERFFEKVRDDATTGCWEWAAACFKTTGYGAFRTEGRRTVTAHRWCYQLMVGDVPDGLHLDHLCRNRRCVNPEHLDPVTSAVNLRRSPLAGVNKTHCPAGHEYTDANTWRNSKGHRFCRPCHARRERQRRLRSDVS